jgi:hypothetical protein
VGVTVEGNLELEDAVPPNKVNAIVQNPKWFVKPALTPCWTLARALLASEFIQNTVDRQILKQVQENYKKRFNPPEHPKANRMCAENLWSYCSDNKWIGKAWLRMITMMKMEAPVLEGSLRRMVECESHGIHFWHIWPF